MKRIGNLYHLIYDIENIKLAHENARKGKFTLLALELGLNNKLLRGSRYES